MPVELLAKKMTLVAKKQASQKTQIHDLNTIFFNLTLKKESLKNE
jgi:hypothetical protein